MIARAMTVIAALGLVACNNASTSKPPAASEPATAPAAATDLHSAFTNLTVDQVSALVAAKKCVPVDANKAETRGQFGVLPGAVLLSDYHDYKLGELPADKNAKLVFYCGGTACTAAPKAAALAVKAGYEDVNVMREGIRGWVQAGKPVDKPST